MNRQLAERIVGIYDSIEETHPDISTERLLSLTADIASKLPQAPRAGFDVSDVAEALEIIRP